LVVVTSATPKITAPYQKLGMRFFILMLFACSAIAAETPISQPVFIPSPDVPAARPFVAAGDGGFLVAWDQGIPAGAITTEPAVVKARTFHEDGTPRQPGEVFIAKGFGAHAAWTGSEYVLAYAKPQFVRPNFFIRIAAVTRVSDEGRVLGNELVLANGSSGSVRGLACDHQHCLALLNVDGRDNLVLFDPAGGVLQTTDVSTWGLAYLTVPLTARTGGGFAALRRTGSVTELVTISTTGSFERVITIPFGQGIAAKDREYAVIGTSGQYLAAAILDENGEVVRTFASAILYAGSPLGGYPLAIAPAGESWIAAVRRPTADCVIRFGRELPLSEDCGGSIGSIAANGLGSMAAWVGGDQVRSVFTQSGVLLDRLQADVISIVAAPQSDASAVVDD
jgi:hypothetical protein